MESGDPAQYQSVLFRNPGKPDALLLIGFPDFQMEIGVAGANGETSGAFTMSIWLDDANLE